jgi:hypothetical protein
MRAVTLSDINMYYVIDPGRVCIEAPSYVWHKSMLNRGARIETSSRKQQRRIEASSIMFVGYMSIDHVKIQQSEKN